MNKIKIKAKRITRKIEMNGVTANFGRIIIIIIIKEDKKNEDKKKETKSVVRGLENDCHFHFEFHVPWSLTDVGQPKLIKYSI